MNDSGPSSPRDAISGERMNAKFMWQLLRPYAEGAAPAGIAPHDLGASLREAVPRHQGELEQTRCYWAPRVDSDREL
jgi:hypothetical protein